MSISAFEVGRYVYDIFFSIFVRRRKKHLKNISINLITHHRLCSIFSMKQWQFVSDSIFFLAFDFLWKKKITTTTERKTKNKTTNQRDGLLIRSTVCTNFGLNQKKLMARSHLFRNCCFDCCCCCTGARKTFHNSVLVFPICSYQKYPLLFSSFF